MNKKSQTELMGLMIIIILLLVIGIFALRFSLRPKAEIIEETRANIQINNLLNAIMKSSTKYDKPILDLIVDCYTEREFCDFIKEEIPKIMNLAMPTENYQFIAKAEETSFINIGKCTGNIIVANYPIRAKNKNFEITLKTCGKRK